MSPEIANVSQREKSSLLWTIALGTMLFFYILNSIIFYLKSFKIIVFFLECFLYSYLYSH